MHNSIIQYLYTQLHATCEYIVQRNLCSYLPEISVKQCSSLISNSR